MNLEIQHLDELLLMIATATPDVVDALEFKGLALDDMTQTRAIRAIQVKCPRTNSSNEGDMYVAKARAISGPACCVAASPSIKTVCIPMEWPV
jgi:hypothetical protein